MLVEVEVREILLKKKAVFISDDMSVLIHFFFSYLFANDLLPLGLPAKLPNYLPTHPHN